jgi:hypothetical protein
MNHVLVTLSSVMRAAVYSSRRGSPMMSQDLTHFRSWLSRAGYIAPNYGGRLHMAALSEAPEIAAIDPGKATTSC